MRSRRGPASRRRPGSRTGGIVLADAVGSAFDLLGDPLKLRDMSWAELEAMDGQSQTPCLRVDGFAHDASKRTLSLLLDGLV